MEDTTIPRKHLPYHGLHRIFHMYTSHCSDSSVIIKKKMQLGWMEGSWPFITTVPFRVFPGASIPKARQHGRFRTIINASLPSPHFAKSAVDKCADLSLPVESNVTDVLYPCMAMEWLSINRVCITLHVLSGVASAAVERIEGRSGGLVQWFKMFCVAHTEQ